MKKSVSVILLVIISLCLVISCSNTPSTPTLTGIYVSKTPYKTVYSVGEKLELSGLIVMGKYSDGSETQIYTYTTEPANETLLTSGGKQDVSVLYEGLRASFPITVSAKVSSIAIKTYPIKSSYYVGEPIDTTGMVLTVIYNDKTTAEITSGFEVSPVAFKTEGLKTVTVIYGEKTTEYQVTVLKEETLVSNISIKSLPTKLTYYVGDSVDTTGLILTVTYSDGKSDEVSSGFTISPTLLNTPGTQTITVSYSNKTTSYVVSVIKTYPVDYLTFSSANGTVSVIPSKYWNAKSKEYSIDGGVSWISYTTGAATGTTVKFRGIGGTSCSRDTGYSSSNYEAWEIIGSSVSCSGNIETILDYEKVSIGEHPEMRWGCCQAMFDGCTSLISAPKLPATKIPSWCYTCMFRGCVSLIVPPELPATSLGYYCYGEMFKGCTSLVNAPVLPAISLAEYCYREMFSYCSSLVKAPMLPATALAEGCYYEMFGWCNSLITTPELPASVLIDRCYSHMFQGCTSLTSVCVLPIIALAEYSCYEMFKDCSSLKIIKNDSTGTLFFTCPSTLPNCSVTDMFVGTGMYTGNPVANGKYYYY